jgi:hypothetical protein
VVVKAALEVPRLEPLDQLAALAALRQSLEAWEHEAAQDARASGASWESIAQVLGLRRQAVWKRYGTPS